MPFADDRLTLWIVAGIIGSIVRELFDAIIILIGLPIIHIASLAVDLFTNDINHIHSWLGVIIGIMTDWIMGAVIGVGIGLVLQWSGRQNYLLKGLGIGLISWVVIFGFLVQGMPWMFVLKPTLFNTLFAIIPHGLYASITAFFIVKFTKVSNH